MIRKHNSEHRGKSKCCVFIVIASTSFYERHVCLYFILLSQCSMKTMTTATHAAVSSIKAPVIDNK
jgi:hypothetical protein